MSFADRARVEGRRGQDRRRDPAADRRGHHAQGRAATRTPTSTCSPAPASSTSRSPVAKLKERYKVNVVLHPPKVPYRETIMKRRRRPRPPQEADRRARAVRRLPDQMEPLERGGDYEFVDEIFGGSIPNTYRPAVDKGIQEARVKGLPRRLPGGRLPGAPHRRPVPRRRLLRDGVQDRRLARLQGRHGERPADHPRADHEGGDHDHRGPHGRHHGRPLPAPGPAAGHGLGERHADHPRQRADGRDARLRAVAALDDPGPGELPHGVLALRRGPEARLQEKIIQAAQQAHEEEQHH